MKVALFTDTYLPDINGVVSSVELLRRKLEENGHDVYVVCTYPGFFKVVREGNIIRLPGIELKNLYGYKATSPAHFLFMEELEEYHFDLIHVHTEFGVGIFAGFVAKHLQIPLIRTYHTTYEDYTHYVNFVHSTTVETMAKKLVSFLSKQYGNGCVRLIAPSRKTAEMLKGYGIKTPIEIIPTGIELQRFSLKNKSVAKIEEIRSACGIDSAHKMFLYVGRLAEEKSITMLLEAVEGLRNIRNDFKLVIVGGGPQEKELHETVVKKGLSDVVFFVGKKPLEMVPSYYHAADAFMSASTTETQGMTYIEALASGLPVFARYDEVLEDLVIEGKNGYYFRDAAELKEKMLLFFSVDENERRGISSEALRVAAEFDSETFAKKILLLYKDAIEEYSSSFTVEKINVKNDYILTTLLSPSGDKEALLISVDDFYDEGIRKGEKITATKLLSLRKKEEFTKTYRLCLKKIAGRDYTIKQMYDFLTTKTELPIQQINEMIDKLLSRKLLDDKRYTLAKLESFEATLMSQRRIINKLRNDGVPVELIEECLSRDDDAEIAKARRMALKYQNGIRNKSLIVKKQVILQKLLRDGFGVDVAKGAVEELDYTKEEFAEKDILKNEAARIRKRLAKKYTGTFLRNRLYNALASKGFRSEAIFAVLNEMEWDENE